MGLKADFAGFGGQAPGGRPVGGQEAEEQDERREVHPVGRVRLERPVGRGEVGDGETEQSGAFAGREADDEGGLDLGAERARRRLEQLAPHHFGDNDSDERPGHRDRRQGVDQAHALRRRRLALVVEVRPRDEAGHRGQPRGHREADDAQRLRDGLGHAVIFDHLRFKLFKPGARRIQPMPSRYQFHQYQPNPYETQPRRCAAC